MKRNLNDAPSIIKKLNFSNKNLTQEEIELKADELVTSSLKAFEYMKKIISSSQDEREKEKERLLKEKTLDPFLNSY
ncbi:hypothetical protein [Candidatus Cetobacterium colombiensis]|uniref:Uncharacterized protein n=1 Tax=Candidatus Cetobacterium colombiensis TaxID=3073100 RepID=A0ABU4WCH7_9FUSO|nr:hypothetical protein [Candidatus Cetobacterium colombiensis]MDX8337216.1 hypothetical protein [Candidatus Cetobacterium colombiensis]